MKNNVLKSKPKGKQKFMPLAASVMLAGMLLSTGAQIMGSNTQIHAATGTTSKAAASTSSVKVNDDSLQAAIKAAKDAGVKVTQDATKTKTVAKADQASATKIIQDDYANQVKEVNAVTDQQKKNNDTYNTAKAKYDKDKAAFDTAMDKYNNDEAAYKTAKTKYDKDLADYNTAKAKYDKDEADYKTKLAEYNKLKAKYDKDLQAWETYMKNPEYQGNTAWTKSQLEQFFNGGASKINYVHLDTNSKFSATNDSPITPAEFAKVMAANPGLKSDEGGDLRSQLYTVKKGLTFRYNNAFTNVVSDKNEKIDIKITVTDFKKWSTPSASPLVIRPGHKYFGMDQYTPLKSVDYQVDFFKSGTNIPIKINTLYSFGDIDGWQYVQFLTPSTVKSLNGNKVVKTGATFTAKSGDPTDSKDPQAQAWILAENLSQIEFRYGQSKQTSQNAYRDDAWETGTLPFLIKSKMKPTPVPPLSAKPKAPTPPKAPDPVGEKPKAPTLPVQKNESISYHLTNLNVDIISSFQAKFIEQTK